MSLNQRKYEHQHEAILRDVRPFGARVADALSKPANSVVVFVMAAFCIYFWDWAVVFGDVIMVIMLLYFTWLISRDRALAFKLPLGSKHKDTNNGRGGKKGNSEGILYLGNVEKTNEEVWFTNSDIRTHFLYLGTTGAGKTEGLKSLVTNSMSWASGFVYIDGKADTDLWSSLSSLVRRFGRDDDLLVLNYMTGNADVQAPSNTMNPFSSGSASYLTNMLVSLMPESGGDNAMWKERAVSLVGSMMPALTWKRDHQEIPLSVGTLRDYLSLNNIIKLARDEIVPAEIRTGLVSYLDTLPGFIHEAYDDEGKVKPPGPDTPQYNTETASQQHGYLAMQFTRSLQSLGDDYGYIFDTQAADVDMTDVVLNRRILVVLVPALEKSGDEVANLGKIVAASIKGMMGSTLGSTVEGDSSSVIENKPTHSSTPFMTVFDEVGYYVAEGMAVMAAQARSLGFSLVFAGQDLPALKKRVREEANSITANCNIKLFGKLEDPTETKEFFEKTVGTAIVTEVSGFQMSGGTEMGNYYDTKQAGVQLRPRASYDGLRGFREGQAVITFGEVVVDCAVFYSNPGFAKAMRVTRYLALPAPDDTVIKHANAITALRDLMVNKTWTAMRADVAVETPDAIAALHDGFTESNSKASVSPVDAAISALIRVHAVNNDIPEPTKPAEKTDTSPSDDGATPSQTVKETTPPEPKKQENPELAAKRTSDIVAETAEKAAPSIFGSTDKKETEATKPAPAAPVEETEPKDEKPAEAETKKPSIFGTTPKKETPEIEKPPATPVKEETKEQSETPKPTVFGTPAKATEPEKEEITKPDPSTEKQEHAKDAEPSETNKKPSIFGTAPTKPETTPDTKPESETSKEPISEEKKKPSIFQTNTPEDDEGSADE